MRGIKRFIGLLTFALAAVTASGFAASAQAQSTWAAIQERGTVRVGVAQAEPWAFRDPVKQEWTGIGPSYARAIAKDLDVEVEFVEVTWGTAIAALQSNKIDVMPMLSITPVRAMAIDYAPTPLSYSALSVLVSDESDATTWDDLDTPDVVIGVNQGSSQDMFLTDRLKKAQILRFSSYAEVIAAYQNGNVNAAAMYFPTLALLASKAGSGKVIIPKPALLSTSGAAVRREDDKQWRDWLDIANRYYYNQGDTQRWYEEFLESRGIDPAISPPIQKELW